MSGSRFCSPRLATRIERKRTSRSLRSRERTHRSCRRMPAARPCRREIRCWIAARETSRRAAPTSRQSWASRERSSVGPPDADACKPGALERRRDLGPGGKLGVDQRLQREEMPMREIALAGAVANADVAAIAQHPVAFPRGGGRVAEMVVDHRDEDEIGAAVR